MTKGNWVVGWAGIRSQLLMLSYMGDLLVLLQGRLTFAKLQGRLTFRRSKRVEVRLYFWIKGNTWFCVFLLDLYSVQHVKTKTSLVQRRLHCIYFHINGLHSFMFARVWFLVKSLLIYTGVIMLSQCSTFGLG